MINIEHQSNVEFLAQFKEANKETRYQSFYDPIQKIWILKPISIDPNAFKFRDNNIKTDADINKEKRQKRAKSPYGVRSAQIKETKPPKIKAEKIIKEKVVRLKPVKKVSAPKIKKQRLVKVKKEPKPKIVREKKGYGSHGGDNGFPRKKIQCSNGNVYDSIYQAAKELNLNKSAVCLVCQGKYKTTKGFTFNYL